MSSKRLAAVLLFLCALCLGCGKKQIAHHMAPPKWLCPASKTAEQCLVGRELVVEPISDGVVFDGEGNLPASQKRCWIAEGVYVTRGEVMVTWRNGKSLTCDANAGWHEVPPVNFTFPDDFNEGPMSEGSEVHWVMTCETGGITDSECDPKTGKPFDEHAKYVRDHQPKGVPR